MRGGEGGGGLLQEMRQFLVTWQDCSPCPPPAPPSGFLTKVWEKRHRSPYLVMAKSKIKGGGGAFMMGHIGGIIQGDNSTGHCFVL